MENKQWVADSSSEVVQYSRASSKSFAKPSWLLHSIADIEGRMKMTRMTSNEAKADTFGDRAEFYYEKRPQILSLLKDLYNRYICLADRYSQQLFSNKTQVFSTHMHEEDGQESSNITSVDYSDSEISVSYQQFGTSEVVIVELVMKTVEYEIVSDELETMNQMNSCLGESTRKKMELQRNLLEVLESERVILLNDNSMLSFRVRALLEENKGLASEALFMKRKAGELARSVLKMREDHRVCMLSRKIEDLQGQIYALEKRNKEYYDKLVEKEAEKRDVVANGGVTLEDCLEVEGGEKSGSVSTTSFNSTTAIAYFKKVKVGKYNHQASGAKKVYQWWDRVKKFDMFTCGPRYNSTCC